MLGIKTAKCLMWQSARFSLKGAGTNTSALFYSVVDHWSSETKPLATMIGLSHLLEPKERKRKSSKTHKKAIKHFRAWCESSSAHPPAETLRAGCTDFDSRTALVGTVTACVSRLTTILMILQELTKLLCYEQGTSTCAGLLNGWWLMTGTGTKTRAFSTIYDQVRGHRVTNVVSSSNGKYIF